MRSSSHEEADFVDNVERSMATLAQKLPIREKTARSRLYRNRLSQASVHFATFFKIYKKIYDQEV